MASQNQQKCPNGERERKSLSTMATSALHRKLAVQFLRIFKVKPDKLSSKPLHKLSLEPLHKRVGQPTTLLSLPTELRLQIYSYLSTSVNSLSRPSTHPFFKLLTIHYTIRLELLDLFFKKPVFSFFTAPSCLTFLHLAASHTHLLTTLTLYLGSTQIQLLELIFEELMKRNAPLRYLNIHFERKQLAQATGPPLSRFCLPGSVTGEETCRVVTAYMIPRRIAISEFGHRNRMNWRQWRANTPRSLDEPYDMQRGCRKNFVYTTDHIAAAVDAAKTQNSFLSRLDTLRYLAVHGQPEDGDDAEVSAAQRPEPKGEEANSHCGTRMPWKAIDFELAILKLHLKLQDVAKREGRKLLMWGSKHQEDRFWFYEAFIEGEESDCPRRWYDRC